MKMIKSLELPGESIYKLTKVKAIDTSSWVISEGQSITGVLMSNPIKLDQRCLIQGSSYKDLISTSWVKKIELKKDKIILTTENSIYELVEVNEPKDSK